MSLDIHPHPPLVHTQSTQPPTIHKHTTETYIRQILKHTESKRILNPNKVDFKTD